AARPRAKGRPDLVREVDPPGERAHGETAEDIGGEGRRGRHRRDVVEPEDGGEDVERGHVPHVEQEDEREPPHAVVESQGALPSVAGADPTPHEGTPHGYCAPETARPRPTQL